LPIPLVARYALPADRSNNRGRFAPTNRVVTPAGVLREIQHVSTAAKNKTNITEVVPFLRVADMPASLRFYVDGLDARIAARWDPEGELRWCRLELGGSSLMLQTFGPGLRERASANPVGLGMSLAFQCADAVALYHDFHSRGIEASEPEVGNGLWNTSVTDPDGYVLEFASPTDLPEETRLSDVAE
jgi:catechol 2,3-dioxygenase-like lactoylglutathione lyase family enzyme